MPTLSKASHLPKYNRKAMGRLEPGRFRLLTSGGQVKESEDVFENPVGFLTYRAFSRHSDYCNTGSALVPGVCQGKGRRSPEFLHVEYARDFREAEPV